MINDNKYTFIATIGWQNWPTKQIFDTLHMETINENFNKVTSRGGGGGGGGGVGGGRNDDSCTPLIAPSKIPSIQRGN